MNYIKYPHQHIAKPKDGRLQQKEITPNALKSHRLDAKKTAIRIIVNAKYQLNGAKD